jgi:hypothetical protein
MDIFFRNQYNIAGCSVPIKLGFKDVIFVMEDVDAASKVVRRRDGQIPGSNSEAVEIPIKSPWQLMLESTSDDCRELVQELMEQSDRLREATLQSETLCSFAREMGAVPALGLIGSMEEALSKLGQEAVENVTQINESVAAVDDFLSRHCRVIKSLLESGIEIDDAFVDELLGMTPSISSSNPTLLPLPHSFPREILLDSDDDDCDPMARQQAQNAKDVQQMHSKNGSMLTTKIASSDQEQRVQGPSVKPVKEFIRDKLNLSGLLNVLDGIVDTPGRILIMTSNHPEVLDPALIRPGRIDKRIMLGHMHPAEIISMVSHYFQAELNTQQKNQIQNLRTTFTPAVVEQLTAEHDSLDDMIDALEKWSSSCATATTSASSSFCID